jgi:hypothetical protein
MFLIETYVYRKETEPFYHGERLCTGLLYSYD